MSRTLQKINSTKIEIVSFIAAVLLILLFAYAAVSKLVDYQRFVAQMQLAPVPLMKIAAPVLGWVIPQIEIVIVIMLLFERYRSIGLKCRLYADCHISLHFSWLYSQVPIQSIFTAEYINKQIL